MTDKSGRPKFNRDAAFSISLENPHAIEEDNIQYLIPLQERLFCFFEKRIAELLTAETIDPDKEDLETRHSYQVVYQVGTSSPIVARTIIQAKKILDSVILQNKLEKQSILNHIWDSSKLLFECEDAHFKIFSQTNELVKECDEIVSNHKNQTHIPPLPQIENLDQYVSMFLGSAKRFLETTHSLLCIFYGAPNFESNFRSYREWLSKNRPESENIIGVLEQDKEWLQFVAHCRNSLSINHSKPGFELLVENFKLQKGNKFTCPSWRHDFSEKGMEKQNEPSDIIEDMNVHMSNMLTFLEEIVLLCIQGCWDINYNFALSKIGDDTIDIRCPLLYEVRLSKSL